MIKNIIKKFLLSISIGVCIGFGIFISYALNNLSEPLIPGSTLTQSWFDDLRLRVVNIYSTGSGGNVGIGTTTPTQKLQVIGNIRVGAGASTNIILEDDESPNGIKYIHANSNNIGFLSGNGSWLSRWDNAGNMVNTASISAGGTITANGGISDSAGVRIDSAGGWFRTYGPTGWYSQNYDGGFYMSDSTWIRTHSNDSIWTGNGILGSQGGLSIGYGGTSSPVGGAIIAGNVGIGTPSPGARIESYGNGLGLYLNQATASDLYIRYHIPGVRWWTVGPKANGDFWFSNSSDHSSNYSFGITSGGNVGIGTSTPTQKLTVAGTIESTSGGFKFPNGTVQTTAANALTLPNCNVGEAIVKLTSSRGCANVSATCYEGYSAGSHSLVNDNGSTITCTNFLANVSNLFDKNSATTLTCNETDNGNTPISIIIDLGEINSQGNITLNYRRQSPNLGYAGYYANGTIQIQASDGSSTTVYNNVVSVSHSNSWESTSGTTIIDNSINGNFSNTRYIKINIVGPRLYNEAYYYEYVTVILKDLYINTSCS